MGHRLLLVEDNLHKRNRILEFVRQNFPSCEIVESCSFTSAGQAIEVQDFDLILLDISLPTYDRVGNESGGRFRPYGGREIARKLIRRGTAGKIIFVTQYSSFSDKGLARSLETLRDEFEAECKERFAGMVLFDSAMSTWKTQLMLLIGKVLQ